LDQEQGVADSFSDSVYWKRPLPELNQKELEELELEVFQKETPPQIIEDSDNIYELFSVLIHSGSAMGGHYYGML
jgi:ubiquitin C-terminal hydrolase